MHVARKDLRQGSGSEDLVPVLGSDEQRGCEGLGRGMGTEDIELEMMFELTLMAEALQLPRWKLTDGPGDCCHGCWTLWRQGRPY